MKKFVAIINSSNSGIRSKESAIDWARGQLNTGKYDKIYLCEVIETVERTQPQVECKPFFCTLEEVQQAAE